MKKECELCAGGRSGEGFRWRRAFAVGSGAIATLLLACATGTEVGVPAGSVDGGGTSAGDDAGGTGPGNVLPGDEDDDAGNSTSGDTDGGADIDSGGTDEEPVGCTDKIVINELMPEGLNNEEFIELYNPNDCAVSVGKWNVLYRSKDNSADQTLFTFSSSQKIAAKSFFVIGSKSFVPKNQAFLLVSTTGVLGNSGGQIGLVDDGTKLIDAVGFGPAKGAYVEGSAAPNPNAVEHSLGRLPDGHDTDDNSADFQVFDTPTPGAKNK